MLLIIFIFWLAQRIQWCFVIDALRVCIFIINVSGKAGKKEGKKEGGKKTNPSILVEEGLRLIKGSSSPLPKIME